MDAAVNSSRGAVVRRPLRTRLTAADHASAVGSDEHQAEGDPAGGGDADDEERGRPAITAVFSIDPRTETAMSAPAWRVVFYEQVKRKFRLLTGG